MNNKSLFITIYTLLISITVGATNIQHLFLNAPENIFPSLTKQQKFELLEYGKLDRKDSILNKFNNHISGLQPDTINNSIKFQENPVSRIQMRLFTDEQSDSLICMIRTYTGTDSISTITFYDTTFRTKKEQFTLPQATAWLKKNIPEEDNIDAQWFSNTLESSYVSARFDKNGNIILHNQLLSFLSAEDKKTISPFLNDEEIVYKRTGLSWSAPKE